MWLAIGDYLSVLRQEGTARLEILLELRFLTRSGERKQTSF